MVQISVVCTNLAVCPGAVLLHLTLPTRSRVPKPDLSSMDSSDSSSVMNPLKLLVLTLTNMQ